MPYAELKGLLTDIGTEASEMFRSGVNVFLLCFLRTVFNIYSGKDEFKRE